MKFRNVYLITFILFVLSLGIAATGFADDTPPPPSDPQPQRSIEDPVPLDFPLALDQELANQLLAAESNGLITPNVIGGSEVSPENSYPWVASLQFWGEHYCGGTLIAPQWVLTAAHCWVDKDGIVYPIQPEDKVVLGEHSLTIDSGREQEIGIAEVHLHPSFNYATFEYDVALLKLSSAATLNTYVQPISLVSSSVGSLVGQASTVLGWGTTVYSTTPSVSDVLRYANISILADSTCSNYGADYKAGSMLCAGLVDGTKDACQGDSGGPLAYQVSGVWKQAGIVSWGYECGVAGYPGIYSRVSAVSDWIVQVSGAVSFIPVLISPANNAVLFDYTPTFTWTAVENATSYDIRFLHFLPNGSIVTTTDVVATNSYTPTSDLLPGTYAWYVRAINGTYVGEWSNPLWFALPVGVPLPLSPPTNDGTYNLTPTFDWSDVSGADHYEFFAVRFDETNTPQTAIYVFTTTSQYTPPANLRPGIYAWYVRAWSGQLVGPWNYLSWLVLFVGAATPLTPPTNAVTSTTPEFTWNVVPGADGYDLYVVKVESGGPTTAIYQERIAITSYTHSAPLTSGIYAWYIRARAGHWLGPWNNPFWFVVP